MTFSVLLLALLMEWVVLRLDGMNNYPLESKKQIMDMFGKLYPSLFSFY